MGMTDPIKNLIKRFFRIFGVEVRSIKNAGELERRTWEKKQDEMWRPFLAHLHVRTIIDIGANTGQFAHLMHRHFPDSSIISVEPLESCQHELIRTLNEFPESQIIQAAAGEEAGVINFFESEFSPCSSILLSTDNISEDYQAAARVDPIKVNVVRMDDVLTIDSLADDVLVKFDVQGFEIPAMRGARKLLSKARIVVCEICFFRKLYKGQPLFNEIYRELYDLGFTYMGNAEQMKRKSDGRIVEADAIFERLSA